ncbi:proline--tRNA ligase [Pararhodospirillum photometricum]|uniref:Proline--tRNA ligase n=1 Tax=Pararhodospirillum photometricum DSM 122 TaxID=1150469 RepID=H6SIP4_PARPM|nr:proline--tRNA ligase [Pararhodospirillum photometricum]CCG06671.1 Prolyl-tRNA synthetase [Pararhodospirillum photometricum DSM 122]
MRLSRYFLPTLKETPSEAEIVSHRLMLRAGLIRQHASGIYSWLPLGLRVLRAIEQVVREEQDAAGAQEILMPTIQSAELWRESGRYDDYGKEMLRIVDRHERDMLYGPTHEEVVTDIFRKNIKSYKDLPKNLYQIHWKFRDEVRPRFGVMRGREFLMKDAYSFDLDAEAARRAYYRMFVAYLRTFRRLGLKAIPMAADTGPIGGKLSHEFIILADTGESAVFCHRALLDKDVPANVDYDGALEPIFDEWTSLYAATDEKHGPDHGVPEGELISARGIEVGHIFSFGTKYSTPMGATVTAQDGSTVPVYMGSYGIGVSRLVGAIIEASHDDAGIIWPDSVAPFQVGLINLKVGDAETDAVVADLEARLRAAGVSVLFDDTDDRPGAKFATMDLIGLPWQVIVGPKGVARGVVELKRRATGEREELSVESALARLSGR